MAHEAQVKYSNMVLAKLRKETILKDGIVFNTDYEGSPSAGTVKVPVRDTEVATGDYNKATGLALGTGTTTYLDMAIDKDKAVNELIDGYDAAAVPDGIVAERLDSAGYSLSLQVDNDGAACLKAGGTILNLKRLTSSSIYAAVVAIRKAMSKVNVPNDGKRYLLVTPEAYALMLLDTANFIKPSDLGQDIVASGAIGKYAGFIVYEWNDATVGLSFIAGHPRFATHAEEFSVPVEVVSLKGSGTFIGSSAVQGRLVYGHKVLRATAIRVVFSPEALEGYAAEGATSGKTILTISGNTGSLKFRIAPAASAVFGQSTASGFTALTSGTTEITAATGTNIEVVEVDGDAKVVRTVDILAIAKA